MRRSIPVVAATIGLALALTACSGSDDSGDDASTAPSESAGATGTLTMWVDDDPHRRDEAGRRRRSARRPASRSSSSQKASGDIGTDFVAQVPTGEGPDIIISAPTTAWASGSTTASSPRSSSATRPATSRSRPSPASRTTARSTARRYAIENIALVRNNALAAGDPRRDVRRADRAGQGRPARRSRCSSSRAEASDPYHLYPLQTSFGAPVFEQTADGSYTDTLALGGPAGDAFATYLAEARRRRRSSTSRSTARRPSRRSSTARRRT